MSGASSLPSFVAPMLAKPGQAFDSDEHLFEIKWDGTRTLCFVDAAGYRLVNRRRIAMTDRYPDLAFLGELPVGTLLDGEMVVLKDGKPDFGLLQSRDHARSALKIRTLARLQPATFVAFDLLYENGQSIMNRPLRERRAKLEKLLKTFQRPGLVLSQGVIGPGVRFFQETTREGLEGVIAKSLISRYLPGQRTDAWIKIKRGLELICVVIGFLPSGSKDFRSLILATNEGGELRACGKVGTGFDRAMRERINLWLWSHLRNKPIVKCGLKGKWVEPGLICRVSCMERSTHGELRAPVFEELIQG